MGLKFTKSTKVFSDINVTPLVDVMLVLLVIFMMIAPLMLNGIKLDLPKTKEVNQISLSSDQIVLSVTKAGQLYLGKNKIERANLIESVRNEMKANNANNLFIRADYGILYGEIARLMSFLKTGGIHSLALVTEIEEKNKLTTIKE